MSDKDSQLNITGDATSIAEGIKTNLDALPVALKKLYHLVFGKREAKVVRDMMLMGAQTELDCARILSGEVEYLDGKLVPSIPFEHNVNSRNMLLHCKEIEEEQNLRSCIREAFRDSLQRDIPPSEEEVSPNFFSRWRSEAVHISDQDMQTLWGRVLSEESLKPESFSLTTLDVLRNIDKLAAIDFQKIAGFIFNGYVPQEKIPFIIRLRLRDAGLLHEAECTIGVSMNVHYVNGEPCNMVKPITDDYIFFPVTKSSYKLLEITRAGRELAPIAVSSHDSIVKNAVQFIFDKNPTLVKVNVSNDMHLIKSTYDSENNQKVLFYVTNKVSEIKSNSI